MARSWYGFIRYVGRHLSRKRLMGCFLIKVGTACIMCLICDSLPADAEICRIGENVNKEKID